MIRSDVASPLRLAVCVFKFAKAQRNYVSYLLLFLNFRV